VDKGQVLDGAEETLFKALALRHLEIPVKVLLDEGMQRELPSTPGIVEALRSNQDDEDRHLEALNYVAAAHGTSDKAEREIMSILEAPELVSLRASRAIAFFEAANTCLPSYGK
jgi:hypothetical protein